MFGLAPHPPASDFTRVIRFGPIAQWLEQATHNRKTVFHSLSQGVTHSVDTGDLSLRCFLLFPEINPFSVP